MGYINGFMVDMFGREVFYVILIIRVLKRCSDRFFKNVVDNGKG